MLEPSWTGRRVSVRRAVVGGARTADVVGDLVRLDAGVAVIETRLGPVEVAVDSVTHARIVAASRADELALEAVAARGMRAADLAAVGGWTLRADHGFLRRANSVLPLRAPGVPLEEALERAGAWYAERGVPLRVALPARARRLLDAELGARGWPIDTESSVLVRRLDPAQPPREVELRTSADDAFLALYRGGEGAGASGRALLERHDRVVFAVVQRGGETVAVGRGVVDGTWLGVSAVEVARTARRGGLASAVTTALWHWGAGFGATHSYLQVERANAPALAAYERLGYWHHHDYHYRRAP